MNWWNKTEAEEEKKKVVESGETARDENHFRRPTAISEQNKTKPSWNMDEMNLVGLESKKNT